MKLNLKEELFKMRTADEILEAINDLSNEERIKLLDEMFDRYYNNRNIPRAEIDWD